MYGERLTELVIPDNVIVIEDYAFSGCSSLINVTIPNSVTGIGYDAFSGCSSLTSVTIPDSVVSIRSDAFAGCSSLSSVTIPDSVIYIESGAFSDCSSLTSVTIASSVISIKNRAFYNCSNLTGVVFLGDAPNDVYSAGSSYSTFPSDVTLYYIAGKSGWTSPTWKGYKTVAITDADAPSEVHTDSYYASLPNYYFQFTDHTGRRLTGVTVTMNGQSFQSGTASSLEFACSGEGATVISKPGYHNVTLPGYLLCAYNEVTLYATGNSTPFVQTAYGSQNGGRSYCNLLSGGMTFYAGSLTEKTAFYIDVNWGSSGGGKVYLSQTLTPGDGVELSEGYNDAQNVSLQLKSSGRLYLLMVTGDGKIFSQSLAANILSASTSEDLNLGLGDTVDIPQPDNDFLSKFKFGVSLPNDIKVKMTVEPDGTVLAALGVELSEAKDVKTTVETIKDALYHADNYPKDWNSFVNALNGSIIPRSISFVVSANSDLVGYAEGKLIQKEDGTFDILFTEGKIAAKIEGKVQKTWQIYPLGIPFYVGGSIEPSVEFGIKLWSNEKEAEILIDPLEVEGKVPIKVRGGLGWDSIASAGIYGKGGITAEFTVPVSEEDLRVYVDASFGAEAKFFVFKADIEILKTEKFYLYGSPDDIPDIGVWMLDTSPMDWQPQSREYLYDTALMEVGEDDVQAGVQTVASGVYPYSDVQLAALGNGDLLAVWTADPGETARPEANNRTVLYYSIYTGSGWSSTAPVESQDDGTADFNPLLTVLDGTAYLLWQDASRPLTANDNVSSTARTMDISVAVFDAASGAFTSLGSVGTDVYDGAASAGLMDGQLAVAWASNSGDNPLAADGQVCALHRAVWDGEQFVTEVLVEQLGAIDQTAIDGTSIWFSADTDYESGTLNDREIFCYHNGLSQCTDNDVADTKPSCRNGSLLWYSDGALVTENGETILLAEDTDRYSYVQGSGGMEAVVYTVTDETRVSSLYASFNDGTGWGEPILLNSAAGNIGSFNASFCPDGTLSIVTSERTASTVTGEYEVPELSSAAQIQVYSVMPVCDLAVSDVTYLAHSLVSGGTLNIQMELENRGMTAVQMATVQVMDGSQVLAEQNYSMDLRSGESISLMVNAPLETVPEQLRVTVTPLGYSDDDEADNAADLTLRLSDVSLEGGVGYSDGSGTTATVLVVNRGQTALNDVVLNLYDEDSTLLGTQTVSDLDVGGSQFVTFALNRPMANNGVLRVEAAESGTENLMSNNSCTILVSAPPEKALTLMASAAETETGVTVVATLRNTTDTARAYSLVCAGYDAEGKLLHTARLDNLSALSGTENHQQLMLSDDDSAKTLKVFLLDSDHIPLASNVELSLG